MADSRFTFNRELLMRIFFFSVFAFLLFQVFLLAKPFLAALLLSIMLSITFYPLYKRLHRVVPNANLAALLMTLCVALAALLPLAGGVWLIVHESGKLIPTVQNVMESMNNGELDILKTKMPPFLYSKFEGVFDLLKNVNIDINSIIMENIRYFGLKVAGLGGFIARNAVFIFFKSVVLILALFMTFRDGDILLNWILRLIPMEHEHKQALAHSAYETFRAVTIGVFLTAAAQGVTAMIGFLIAGIRLPVLLGLATSVTSLLGASFVVTLPVALVVMINSPGWGFFLLLWGAFVVGVLDNFLKPILIGSRTRMPFVLVFFSILGGLKMYGLLGLVLGPILVACVLTFIRIYRETYSA